MSVSQWYSMSHIYHGVLLLSPTWAEGTVLSLSVCLSVCLSAEFCCLNWHNSKTKSSVTVKLCKGMANDAFYGVS